MIAASATSCRLCGSLALDTIYRVENIPVHSCVLLNTPEEARAFPRRDLELAFCHDCGFVFNRVFDEDVMRYSPDSEESQHFSDTFNSFARQLASDVVERYQPRGKRVLEIGCGKGEFLLELCVAGDCRGIGIDPGFRIDRIESHERVEFLQEFFGPQHYAEQVDLILCRHTLEHICHVATFVESIREMVGDQKDVAVFFETPDAKRVLSEGAFWDIYYEHCSYFSPGAHARLFRQAGFDVDDLGLVYDEQYIVQSARPSADRRLPRIPLEDDLDEVRRLAAAFPTHVEAVKQRWRDILLCRAEAGERVVLWGGSSKGVSFLTTLGLQDEVDCVVDINPYKQGKFMPGTGHEVIAPSALSDHEPSLVIVMNPIYVDEIRNETDKLHLSPRIEAV